MKKDFHLNPSLEDSTARAKIVLSAYNTAISGFRNLYLEKSKKNGRECFEFALVPHELVIRKLAQNIKRLTGVKQSSRDQIISGLKAFFRDGSTFRVYRYDVRKFYESISRSFISSKISKDVGFPPASQLAWTHFDKGLTKQKIAGLPVGIGLSAVLSEYLMRDFDEYVKGKTEVHYYARFVDDIIIVTCGSESINDFRRDIDNALPEGLKFNRSKSREPITLSNASSGGANIEIIEFLGYKFSIGPALRIKNSSYRRQVKIDISDSKVKKIKSKIIMSLKSYERDGSFKDFHDRIKLITANYYIYDRDECIRRPVGNRYNYKQIDLQQATNFASLDKFLQYTLGKGFTKNCKRKLLPANEKILKKYRFRKGFEAGTFYNFSAARLNKLTRSWAYV